VAYFFAGIWPNIRIALTLCIEFRKKQSFLVSYRAVNYIIRIGYGNRDVLWDNVQLVEFTLSSGRDYRDKIIRITEKTNNKKHNIHTKLYINSSELRMIVETLCQEKGIKIIVKDRG
jgi:hypothetical protein